MFGAWFLLYSRPHGFLRDCQSTTRYFLVMLGGFGVIIVLVLTSRCYYWQLVIKQDMVAAEGRRVNAGFIIDHRFCYTPPCPS